MKKSQAVAKLMDLRDEEFKASSPDKDLIEALCIAIEDLSQGDYQTYMAEWHEV